MLYRLASRSFMQQLRIYFGYFLSMSIAVMIYYSFSAMTYDQPLLRRASQDVRIENFLSMGSFMVILVILFFMVSANRFFVNKRYKEVGLYRLFGMSKLRISLLFFWETMVLGSISLVVGIFFGIVFSKLFSMILVKAMDLSVGSDFFISWPSIWNTIVVFFFILLLVSVRSTLMIFQYQLGSFFKQKNSALAKKMRVRGWTFLFGFLGIAMLLTGYGLALFIGNLLPKIVLATDHYGWIVSFPLLIFFLCVVGTYLFFGQTMKVIYYLIGKWRDHVYRDLNILSLGNAKVHLAKSWRTMSWVAIILGISLASIGGTAFLVSVAMKTVQVDNPASFQVREEDVSTLKEVLAENDANILSEVSLTYKVVGAEIKTAIENETNTVMTLSNLISEKDYESFKKIYPELPEISLLDDKHVVILDSLQTIMKGFDRYESDILFSGNIATTFQKRLPDYLGDSLLRYMGLSGVTFVVSDEVFKETKGMDYRIVSINVSAKNEETLTQGVNEVLEQSWGNEIISSYHITESGIEGEVRSSTNEDANANESSYLRLNLSSRYPNVRAARRQMGILIYVAVFIGMISMIATGCILMLRQFSEAESEKENYKLLKKMGIPRKQLNRLIYQKNAGVFFPPMILGMMHAYFAIYVFSEFAAEASYWLAYLFCVLLMVVYGFFYLLTILMYGKILEK